MIDKVLFLDIDGPMIPTRAWAIQPTKGPMQTFDPVASGFIALLIKKSGAKIVLSSTWRKMFTQEEMMAKFESEGIPREMFHEDWRTIVRQPRDLSDYRNFRADEIREWLSRHPEVTTFAAVDDDYMELDNFVHVATDDGILIKDQNQLLKLLDARL